MINIFKRKRQQLTITAEDPTYVAHYLGNAPTIHSKGEGCCDDPVAKIWQKTKQGKNTRKVKITITPRGLRLDFLEKLSRGPAAQFYLLHRMSYCVADRNNQKIFAWVYRHELKRKAVELRCHAVLCNKSEKAKAMALCLYQVFTMSFVDYKRERKDRERRSDTGQPQDPRKPPLPRRRILKGASKFRPPLERTRSAPKLGAIREDRLREEEEEEEDEELRLRTRDDFEIDKMADRVASIGIGNDIGELRRDTAVTELLNGDTLEKIGHVKVIQAT